MRIADLGLSIAGTELESCIAQLHAELQRKGFAFRPHCWLSDEWFCPDGVPGIAIPFFLAHPRLKRLEREHMLDVEGGTRAACMKLLRHETGHALVNAYLLQRRAGWRQQFGNPNAPYPEHYLPKPYSKRFVIHLDDWYAQSHAHEDWAETFAVWLKPNSDWRTRYQGWSALKKLQYVDKLMTEIKGTRPRVRNRRQPIPLRSLRITLGEYYAAKQTRYGGEHPGFYDQHLLRLFSRDEADMHKQPASAYLERVGLEILATVSRWTAEYRYRIHQVLQDMARRSDELDLHVGHDDAQMKLDVTACLTMLVMNNLHGGGFHIAL